jgi:hypothetical protein
MHFYLYEYIIRTFYFPKLKLNKKEWKTSIFFPLILNEWHALFSGYLLVILVQNLFKNNIPFCIPFHMFFLCLRNISIDIT